MPPSNIKLGTNNVFIEKAAKTDPIVINMYEVKLPFSLYHPINSIKKYLLFFNYI